tara:strand:+ start:3461 stop:3724 length:264 start_codon:yes stop_codon:yes gene_type:complete
MKYYSEEDYSENISVREFLPGIDYPWHRDREDRHIEVLQSNETWRFQKDNELPFQLEKGLKFFIKKMKFHRLISGEGNLVLKVTKIE